MRSPDHRSHRPGPGARFTLGLQRSSPALLFALAVPFVLACGRTAVVETDPRRPDGPNPTPVPAAAPSVTGIYPGASWTRIDAPEYVGYSSADFDDLHEYIEGLNTTAVMAIVNGQVLFEHGPVDSLSYLASVRKSILAMLYGNYIEDGTIDLDWTLDELGMDDVQGLMPVER